MALCQRPLRQKHGTTATGTKLEGWARPRSAGGVSLHEVLGLYSEKHEMPLARLEVGKKHDRGFEKSPWLSVGNGMARAGAEVGD